MKRIFLCGLVTALGALGLSALPAFSADSGALNMTVAVASPCLTVAPDSGTFGPKSFSASAEAPATTDLDTRPTVTNCSQTSEALFVRATDALGSGGASWTLTDPQSIGVNHYALKSGSQALDSRDAPVTSGPLAAGDLIRPVVLLYMPTAGSDGSGQTMSMSLTYTATF
jgi:hypothetical protein